MGQTCLLLDTGMRAEECCALRPEHVDFKTKPILIEKSKKQEAALRLLLI
ncbi:tyrosine-type recombinase/integrase [Thermaerobacillus caldiproteolyticus]|nr:tyrosine-type recombinase/integrase [Anoxybacillus caldiproteolyticus]